MTGVERDGLLEMLGIAAIIAVVILIVLIIILVVLYLKTKSKEKNPSVGKNGKQENNKKSKKVKGSAQDPASIYEFMEFEDIVDNMIIQKEKSKYIMVIECQGINYDLMSGIERTAVEEGFIQFLNVLRHPVQLYIQTRTIDLGESINRYNLRVKNIEKDLYRLREEYSEMAESGQSSQRELQKKYLELARITNLYEYGLDIIKNTEDLSLNRNILSKKYYVVVPCYISDLGEEQSDYHKDEMRNMAFSELYNRSQSIIRSLASSSVTGKILNTKELIELMYVAYNRDHEEAYNFDKALTAQYDKLYSTSEDVFEKRIKELDKVIEEQAVQKAKEKVDEARTESERRAKEKEENMNKLIDELAKIIIEDNKRYIGDEIAEEAIEKIDEGGEDVNG